MSYWKVLDARYLDRPLDLDAVFGRTAPFTLEIGFGRGDHLIHLGKKLPDYNIIGIEISQPSLRKASGKVKNNSLTNVRVVDGSGPMLLWTNIAPQTIEQLHVNFPDPWHKEGHQHRRLINPEFLHLAATRMKEGALLFVATDHPDYQPVVTDCLEKTPYFDSRLDSTYTLSEPDRFTTKYEQKALREGRVPFYYKFVRNAQPAPNTFIIPEELPVPHAIVQLPLSFTDMHQKFEPFEERTSDGVINASFKEAFVAANFPTFLIETYIRQDPQDQRIGLIIHEREPNEFIVKMHTMGFPRTTDGVHYAVGRLANWLASLHEDGRIVHHNLQRF